MTAIRLERVHKSFGTTNAVDGVDLELPPGKLSFLLGPSGCGKTTLLRMIAGFLAPTSGRILFDGSDVSTVPANRRNTGMVFQSYALWPHMTVADNVAFGLEVRKRSKAEIATRVQEALDLVRMGGLGRRKPAELSGGQQQRVALARALVFRPSVLLLDEPLSNLDAKLRLEMRTEIRRIVTETGITAVYVTHDQEEALSVADVVVVLDRGQVRQAGPPQELYRRPSCRFVADFLGETNFLEGTIVADRGDALEVDTTIGRLRAAGLTARSPRADRVVLSIRPEALRLSVRADDPNPIAAHFVSSIYLGRAAQHRVRAGDRELRILEQNPRGLPADGASLAIAVEPDDVVVLPAGD
jgi:iron(III) transport system ATP-binding protein